MATHATSAAPVKATPDPDRIRPAWFDPTPADIARFEIVRRSQFNRDLLAVARHVKSLMARVRALAKYSRDDLFTAWVDAGLRPDDGDPLAEQYYDTFDDVADDARGFLWALTMYLSTVDTHRIDFDDERDDDQDDDAPEPCVVARVTAATD